MKHPSREDVVTICGQIEHLCCTATSNAAKGSALPFAKEASSAVKTCRGPSTK